MIILDGKKYRDELLKKYKEKINDLDITLAIIETENTKYVQNKIKYCEKVGIKTVAFEVKENEKEIIDLIKKLNKDKQITGIIIQYPFKNLNYHKIVNYIDKNKDVDGLTKENIYNLYTNNETIIPATVKGIIKLLNHYNIKLEGKHIAIVGKGTTVGKPLALALLNKGATVTLCHSKTKNIKDITKNADIVISATGKPNLIKEEFVKKGFIGIDAGISINDGKLVGDFDFENIKDKASYITKVPGGVGPMTIAMVIENLIEIKERGIKK